MKRALVWGWIPLLLVQGCTGKSPSSEPPAPNEVAVSPSTEHAAGVVASVICTESGTVVSSSVRARPNGLEVLIRNSTDDDVNIAVGRITTGPKPEGEHGRLADGRWFESGIWASRGDNKVLPGAVEAQVWIVPPGPAGVACLLNQPGSWPPRVVAEFDILDPARLYVSPDLSCADATTYEMSLGEEVPDVPTSVPGRLLGLREGDSVEYTEYPKQRSPGVRVVRDGGTIAIGRFHFDHSGGLTVCRGLNLRPEGFPPP